MQKKLFTLHMAEILGGILISAITHRSICCIHTTNNTKAVQLASKYTFRMCYGCYTNTMVQHWTNRTHNQFIYCSETMLVYVVLRCGMIAI